MIDAARMLADLERILDDCTPAALAVSGGVDSMTLGFIAHRRLGREVVVYHAVSPAVPPSATARVSAYGEREGWQLHLFDAGEFADANYRQNPVNRCFYCKSHLYQALAAGGDRQLLSGTNLDDLQDWRPGLLAARSQSVRHPYVEAKIDKAGVRAIARHLALEDLAELPAAPCLSSRIETGLPIEADMLHLIDRIETMLRARLNPLTVRCRLRRQGLVIELDPPALAALSAGAQEALMHEIGALPGSPQAVSFAPYQRGGAFLRPDTGEH